jgi:hypothetical protein
MPLPFILGGVGLAVKSAIDAKKEKDRQEYQEYLERLEQERKERKKKIILRIVLSLVGISVLAAIVILLLKINNAI